LKIEFKNIIPFPLSDLKFDEQSVWSNQFFWSSKQKTILNAISGKGKSTFVGIVSGVRKDFNGELVIDGRSTKEFTHKDWSEYRTNKIATVYQDLQLLENLTVWQNLLIKNQLTNHYNESRLVELLEALDMYMYKDRICMNLSLGQKQRIAIIRAICQPFKLLLLDEPFSHLDEENTKKALELMMAEVEKNKAGFILTTLGEKPKCDVNSELLI